jgi:hypothetical protein
MAKQLFKGFKQVLTGETFENGYLYFVRENEAKTEGYIYFNGKKYGTTHEVASELTALNNAITAETSARATAIAGVQGQISAETTARETAISGVQGQITAETSARTVAIEGVQGQIAAEISARTANDVADVEYDSQEQKIYIQFNDGTVSTGFDASAFIVDGMLSSVTYDSTAHTITFIWNTDAGGKEITVDLDDVIAPYNADERTIHKGDSNTFSAIMDQTNGVASYAGLLGVQGQVTAETSARETAISGVQGQISAEASARTADIQGVQSQLGTAIEGVQGQISGVQSRIDGLDATVSASSNGVVVELTEVDGVITNITVTAPHAITGLTVNGQEATVSNHAATVEIFGKDIKLGEAVSGITSGQTITYTLTDIYTKLAALLPSSSDDSIKINGSNFTLNRETATDATVAAGHLAILLNASGETYAQMYYDGNDVA